VTSQKLKSVVLFHPIYNSLSNQIGRDVPTFADAAAVADLITQNGVKYDSVVIVYNKFVNAISYEAAAVDEEALKESSACFFK
jgi:F-type H+-transporting ATPase subunit gamma